MPKTNQKKKSVKTKIVYAPLLIVLLAVIAIASASSFLLRKSMLNQMKSQGIIFVEEVTKELNNNYKSLEVINTSIENKIRETATLIEKNKKNLSNNYLKELATDTNSYEINYFDSKGTITYSNLKDNLNWSIKSSFTHPGNKLVSTDTKEIMQEIRKNKTSRDYYKYGYIKFDNGDFIQIGILANDIYYLTESFSPQSLVDNISKNENVVYAMILDTNSKVTASSNDMFLGITQNDPGSILATKEQKQYSAESFYAREKKNVYDVINPIFFNEKHVGAIKIGLSMDNVNNSVKNNIIFISGLAAVSFVFLSIILFFVSNMIVNTLNNLKDNLILVSNGDFTVDLDEKYLKLTDEFGEISNSIETMKGSIKKIIKDIKVESGKASNNSHILATSSEELSASSEELAATMMSIADSSAKQSQDLVDINTSMQDIAKNIKTVYLLLEKVSKETNTLSQESDEIKSSLSEDTYKNFETILNSAKNIDPYLNETYKSMKIIIQKSILISDKIESASDASERNTAATEQVAAVTEELTSASQEVAISAQELNEIGDELLETIKQFKE